MFNNQKISFPKNKGAILTIFLLFCVASSKGIIIYNEETLVALSFGLFVIFCYSYFGNTIKESLDERTFTIQSGLENFHRLKEESLQKLLSFHKRSLELKKAFPSLKKDNENLVSHTTLSSLVYTTRFVNKKKGKKEKVQTPKWEKKRFPGSSIELYNNFCEKIIQKLVVFKSSKASLHQRLQNSIALHLKESVLCKIKKIKQDKSSNLVSKQVKQGLKLLAVK